MKHLLLFLFSTLMISCAGYQLGGNKPANLAHIKKIQVPLFLNDTQLTKADSYATNASIDAILQDGTYQIATLNNADAILYGTVKSIDYNQVSSSRDDSLRSEELSMEITIKWKLQDASNPLNILAKGTSRGHTRFFTKENLAIARTNALPDALRRACQSMVSRIADGF